MSDMNSDLNSNPENGNDQASSSPVVAAGAPSAEVRPNAVGDWKVVVVKTRVDSFNQDTLVEEIRALREAGHKRIALDLKSNRFLSLPVIQFCVEISHDLKVAGGSLAMIGCQQKTKRHFEIYGSLKHIQMVRFERELEKSIEV